MRCEFIKADGSQCKTFAIKKLVPAMCIFHADKSVLKTQVYTPTRDLVGRIRLLNKRMKCLRSIKDEATRTRLTLDIISKLEMLEAALKAESAPSAQTTAEKLKSWKG